MIYFNVIEMGLGLVFLCALGCILGGMYTCAKSIIIFLLKVVFLPIDTFQKEIIITNKDYKSEQKKESGIIKNLFDFLFLLVCAILFIVVSYIFLDGAVRILCLLFFIVGFIISFKFLSGLITRFVIKTTDFIYRCLTRLCFIALYPLFFIIRLIKKLLKPIIKLTAKALIKKKNKRIIVKKLKGIENFLLK